MYNILKYLINIRHYSVTMEHTDAVLNKLMEQADESGDPQQQCAIEILDYIVHNNKSDSPNNINVTIKKDFLSSLVDTYGDPDLVMETLEMVIETLKNLKKH